MRDRRARTCAETAWNALSRSDRRSAASALEDLRSVSPDSDDIPAIAAALASMRPRRRWVLSAAFAVAVLFALLIVLDVIPLTPGPVAPTRGAESPSISSSQSRNVPVLPPRPSAASLPPASRRTVEAGSESGPPVPHERAPANAEREGRERGDVAASAPMSPPHDPPPRDSTPLASAAAPPLALPPPAEATSIDPLPVTSVLPPPAEPPVRETAPPNAPRPAAAVEATLREYERAYERLDSTAVRLWPDVDVASLDRAFASLDSQRLRFSSCDIQVTGAAAQAICRGTSIIVPRIGARTPRQETLRWNFLLQQSGERWTIVSARATR
jgi:hypothetical protein